MFRWTEKTVEKLRRLASKGLKSAEIGGILGCSHDTVIRKCGHEGIALLARPNRIVGISPGSIRRNPKELLPLTERIGAGPAVAALTYRQCAWPIGDPVQDDFHYCCKPRPINISPPYCPEHQHLALSKVASARK